ncbi:DegT/DnrJ/EryC1/StrS family aminotransferase [Candidatus Pelagibacter giovannonii]|uniref:DegT/DnrJ/EryC1/StrS family aminotransferase n=1 Tax=Candidatus Pelagibacter giovannonii TaxID=2563896 RepID=A0A6H1Q1Z0_9PROT|nr:DegT/DnrJ/EryC1/StrS family aminotransferase [Candidatus Pelagibacter giovannonii]QIZ20844.1 DegT/DnrJ/EryC1/StrS family aminotransferase [Candidatus Pelagibacter giovannonii]
MKIRYNYLSQEFENTKNIFFEWKKLIKTTDFTLGHKVEEFEKKIGKFLNIKYIISTNNGTDALKLSLKSIGIKNGDEVITVCNSFYASAGAIVALGARPVFIDCDDRFQMNYNLISNAINNKTKAIMPVHWGGASPDMDKITKIAKKYNLKVIEDACMGIGGNILGKSPGSFGDISAFSMHPLKSLNVMGDGGFVGTNNKSIFNWLKKYRNHGMIDRDRISFWGENFRLQPLQAVVALNQLKKLKKVIKIRNNNAKYLDKQLSALYPNVKIPPRPRGFKETFALYMANFSKRNELRSYLLKRGVETKIHYPIPLHLQKASKKFNYKKKDFPVAEKQSKSLITIPVHQYLDMKHMQYISNLIRKFYEK